MVSTKWLFMYMKLARSSTHRSAMKKAWKPGSKNVPVDVLEVDDRLAVGERDRPVALRDPAHGLVAEVGQHEQADLPQGIRIALGKLRSEVGGRHGAHGANCKGAATGLRRRFFNY